MPMMRIGRSRRCRRDQPLGFLFVLPRKIDDAFLLRLVEEDDDMRITTLKALLLVHEQRAGGHGQIDSLYGCEAFAFLLGKAGGWVGLK